MEEYLYLSHSKLRSFLERPGRLRVAKAEVGLKALGTESKVALESAQHNASMGTAYRQLMRVQRHLLQSDRWLYWYEDESVDAGDWVEFEARLGVTMVENVGEPIVIFTSAPSAGGDTALLLHGSQASLMSSSHVDSPPTGSGSSPANLSTILAGFDAPSREDKFPNTADRLVSNSLDLLVSSQAATVGYPRLEGWARVTARIVLGEQALRPSLKAILLATPLYVRYIGAPSNAR